MNPELEKLVEYALSDGYISDKDREVLFRKAQHLGFDTDELEMILEGKLYEQNKKKPQPNKCPGCGEILKGISKVCPSCDYVLDTSSKGSTETLDVSMKKIDNSILGLSYVPTPGASDVFKATILSLITLGLYIIYKKVIKKESLFDANRKGFDSIALMTTTQINQLRQKYGADRQINDYLDNATRQIIDLTKKRDTASIKIGALSFGLAALIIYIFSNIPKLPDPPKKVETAEEKTERLIKSDSIGKAKITAAGITDITEREQYLDKLQDMEIDSLTKAADYNNALLLADNIKEVDTYSKKRETKIDQIIELEVRSLIKSKDFARAYERAEIASYYKKDALKESIKLAETVEKDIKKKRRK